MSEQRIKSAVLISNPNAGRGGASCARDVKEFREALKAHGVDTQLLNTRGPNDATVLAERVAQEGARTVIVSGGDGTINEALQGLVGTDTRLAILPRGTANVLARELELPFAVERAAEVIARGNTKKAYVGRATIERTGQQRYFILMAGIGLDASVVSRVRPGLKRRIGEAAFWYAGFGHLLDWKPIMFNVEVDGEKLPATFAAVGKAGHYGGNLAITPRARLDTPEFEICTIASKSRFRFLYLLTHAMRAGGVRENLSGVRFIRTSKVRVTGDVQVQIDGELTGELPITFEIVPSPVEIIS